MRSYIYKNHRRESVVFVFRFVFVFGSNDYSEDTSEEASFYGGGLDTKCEDRSKSVFDQVGNVANLFCFDRCQSSSLFLHPITSTYFGDLFKDRVESRK